MTIDGEERPFYENEEHENGDEEKDEESSSGEDNEDGSKEGKVTGKGKPSKHKVVMDPDHRLLLKNARPLLQSRNSAVRKNSFPQYSIFILSLSGLTYPIPLLLYLFISATNNFYPSISNVYIFFVLQYI